MPPGQPPRARIIDGISVREGLVTAAIALAAGFVPALIVSIILLSGLGDSSWAKNIPSGALGFAAPFILFALALGGSAVARATVSSDFAQSDATIAFFISGAPLVITAIFVAVLCWWSRWSERRHPSQSPLALWLRIGMTTLAFTVVLFLLQLIFAARGSVDKFFGASASAELSAVTVRSFFLPLLFVLIATTIGRMLGHPRGCDAIGAPWLRYAVAPARTTMIHLCVVGGIFFIVALFALPLGINMPGRLVPLLSGTAALFLAVLSHLGGFGVHGTPEAFRAGVLESDTATLFSQGTPGLLWLGLLVVLIGLLIAALAAAVTQRPSWHHAPGTSPWTAIWRLPLAFAAVWGLLSLVLLPIGMHMSASGPGAESASGFRSESVDFSLGLAPWTFLIFALWGLVVEVLAITVAPRLALAMPALAARLGGRAVHPFWGPHLGIGEPRGALRHPDMQTASPPVAAPTAPMPGAPGVPPTGSVPQVSQPGSVPQVSQPGSAAYSGPGSPGFAAPLPQGATLPPPYAAGPAMGPAPGPPMGPPKALDSRKVKLYSITAGVAVLALVAGIIAVTQVNSRFFGPDGAVRSYLSKIASGDADGALAMADVDVPTEQRTLLTNEVLAAAKARPDSISITDSEITGDTATVTAQYDVGGSKNTVNFALRRAGRTAVFFNDWRLESPELGQVSVATPNLAEVTVNGVTVPVEDGSIALPAFPAMYTVSLPEKNDYVTADDVTVRAFFGGGAESSGGASGEDEAQLEASPTPKFTEEVNKQVRNLLDSCAKKTEAKPSGCPFGSSYAESSDVKQIKWSVDSYPETSLSESGSGGLFGSSSDSGTDSDASAWHITTDTSGTATITGKHDFLGQTSDFEDTARIDISGTASIVDGKVVTTIEDYRY